MRSPELSGRPARELPAPGLRAVVQPTIIRAVLDTNGLASGASNARGPSSGLLFLAWRRRAFTLVASEPTLAELEARLDDRYFHKHLTHRERQALVPRLRRQAWVTEITSEVFGIAPSPADDRVLATARSGAAPFVVTGDVAFQALDTWVGIRIVSPRRFLEILRQEGG